MFDVSDLPVLTFGNCVLSDYVACETIRTLITFFFSKSKKNDFLRFLSCCSFLEHCCEDSGYAKGGSFAFRRDLMAGHFAL